MITWWRVPGERIKHAWVSPTPGALSACKIILRSRSLIRTYPGPARGVLLDAASAQPCQACQRSVM